MINNIRLNASKVRFAAWAFLGLQVFIVIITIILIYSTPGLDHLVDISILPVLLMFAIVGAIIASKLPKNPIGWILLTGSFFSVCAGFSNSYVQWALTAGFDTGVVAMAWVTNWAGNLGLSTLLTLTFIFFPDGLLPSRKWQLILWLIIFTLLVRLANDMFLSGPLASFPQITNPNGFLSINQDTFETASGFSLLLTTIACVSSLFVRYPKANPSVRLQIRTLSIPLLIGVITIVFAILTSYSPVFIILDNLFFVFWVFSIPIAIGVSILRYRLLDIDLIIRRTVVYSLLMGSLAFVYFGSVIFSQQLLRTITGQRDDSQLAIVVSTLAIILLFQPLRRVIQNFIDRRFYRKKYNVERTLQAFSVSIRDEVSLEKIDEHLISVVLDTMQPQYMTLWLSKPEVKGLPKDQPLKAG